MGAVTSDAALPPTGWVKSYCGPSYHWYRSEVPVATTVSVALVPGATATLRGCAVICGAVHAATIPTAATMLSSAPQRFDARTQYDVGAKSGGVVSVGELPFGMGCETSPRSPSY